MEIPDTNAFCFFVSDDRRPGAARRSAERALLRPARRHRGRRLVPLVPLAPLVRLVQRERPVPASVQPRAARGSSPRRRRIRRRRSTSEDPGSATRRASPIRAGRTGCDSRHTSASGDIRRAGSGSGARVGTSASSMRRTPVARADLPRRHEQQDPLARGALVAGTHGFGRRGTSASRARRAPPRAVGSGRGRGRGLRVARLGYVIGFADRGVRLGFRLRVPDINARPPPAAGSVPAEGSPRSRRRRRTPAPRRVGFGRGVGVVRGFIARVFVAGSAFVALLGDEDHARLLHDLAVFRELSLRGTRVGAGARRLLSDSPPRTSAGGGFVGASRRSANAGVGAPPIFFL